MADQTFELDDAAVTAIAEKVAGNIDIEKIATSAAEKSAEAVAAKIAEKTAKPVNKIKGETDEVEADDDDEGQTSTAQKTAARQRLEKDTKEKRLMRAAVALVNGDVRLVREYNTMTLEARQKAGYGNEGTNADGKYLVPDPDFDAEVERLEEQYGVAINNADVRRINSNSVKLNKKGTGFELVETNEAEAKTGLKFTIDQVTASLRKFAGIVPATDELVEDSAVDYWAEITREAARANAQKQDEIVFTDATSGILHISGTAAQSVGNALTDLDWDDLLDAEVKVPTPSAKNGKWYLHRTVWNKLVQSKPSGGDGHYFFQPNPNGLTTPWGTPVVLTEVLPAAANIGSNTAFGVFGDLSYYKMYIKNGLQLKMLDQATVKDADGNTVNLALQDMSALRMVVRMLGIAKFPEAFCLLGTGTVS